MKVSLDIPLTWVTTHQYLGIWLNSRFTFRAHIAHLQERAASRISVLQVNTSLKGDASFQVKTPFYIHAIPSLLGSVQRPCLISLTKTLY